MQQTLALTALLVADYDEALRFYVGVLGFERMEDRALSPDKRWVVVRPKGAASGGLLLAKAADARQRAGIGDQAGGRAGGSSCFSRPTISSATMPLISSVASCSRTRRDTSPMAASRCSAISTAIAGT
ncbi:hypothetical protein M673_00372 [Aureimonas sp. AU20]|nr:hypothetical protein M673_00372 [Aureimonas sp. AU20]